MECGGINLASQTDRETLRNQDCASADVPFLSSWPVWVVRCPFPDMSASPWRIVSWVCLAPSCFPCVCPPDGSMKQKGKHWEIMSLMCSKIGN